MTRPPHRCDGPHNRRDPITIAAVSALLSGIIRAVARQLRQPDRSVILVSVLYALAAFLDSAAAVLTALSWWACL